MLYSLLHVLLFIHYQPSTHPSVFNISLISSFTYCLSITFFLSLLNPFVYSHLLILLITFLHNTHRIIFCHTFEFITPVLSHVLTQLHVILHGRTDGRTGFNTKDYFDCIQNVLDKENDRRLSSFLIVFSSCLPCSFTLHFLHTSLLHSIRHSFFPLPFFFLFDMLIGNKGW